MILEWKLPLEDFEEMIRERLQAWSVEVNGMDFDEVSNELIIEIDVEGIDGNHGIGA